MNTFNILFFIFSSIFCSHLQSQPTLDKQIGTEETNPCINDFSDNLDPAIVQEGSLKSTQVKDSSDYDCLIIYINRSSEHEETSIDDFNVDPFNPQNEIQENIQEVTQEDIEKIIRDYSQGSIQDETQKDLEKIIGDYSQGSIQDETQKDLEKIIGDYSQGSIQDETQRNVSSSNHGFTSRTSEEKTQVTKVETHPKATQYESHAHSVSKVTSYTLHAKNNKRKNSGSNASDQPQSNKKIQNSNTSSEPSSQPNTVEAKTIQSNIKRCLILMNNKTKIIEIVDGSSFLSFAENAKRFYANISEEGKSEVMNKDNTQDTTQTTSDKTKDIMKQRLYDWPYYMHYYYLNSFEDIENKITKDCILSILNEFLEHSNHSTPMTGLFNIFSMVRQTNPDVYFIPYPLFINDYINIEAIYQNSNIIYMNIPSDANQMNTCASKLQSGVRASNDSCYKSEIQRMFYEDDLITLKPELWYLMSMMPELLFYIEWRLTKSLRMDILTKLPDNIQKELNIMALIVRYIFKEIIPKVTIEDDVYILIKLLRFTIRLNLELLDCQPVRSGLYACGIDYLYIYDSKKINYECFIKVLLIYPFTLEHNLNPYETRILKIIDAHNIEVKTPSCFLEQFFFVKSNHLQIIFNLMLVIDYVCLIKGISVNNNYKILLIKPYFHRNLVICRALQSGKLRVCLMNNAETLGLLMNRLKKLMQIDVNQLI